MSADACASLVDVAYLYSQLPLSCNRNDRPVQALLLLLNAAEAVASANDRPVQALLMLLDAAVAVASAIDDNILEDLQALPVDDQNKIKSRLDKIAEKTTQPPPKHLMDEAAKPEPFPVDLAALHDTDFSDGLSTSERLAYAWGVAPASAQPAAIAQPAEVDQLTPKEVEAQECFTALRDKILNLNDGLEVNKVLHIIDNHTPEWV